MFFINEIKKVIPLNFSASLSYYLVLALVPSFLLIYMFSFYFIKDLYIVYEIIILLFPKDYASDLIVFLDDQEFSLNVYLIFLILICINIISNGISNLSKSIDLIFNFKSKKNIKVKSLLISILLIILEGVLLYVASFINYHFNIFQYLRFLSVYIIVLFSLLFMLEFIPSISFRLKDVFNYCVIGSFVISILLIGYNIFIDYYSNFDFYYGPLSTLVSILILFKFIANIVALLLYYLSIKKT